MKYEIEFVFPLPPNRANDSKGWRARKYGKDRYLKSCEPELFIKKLKCRGIPWTSVQWTAHFGVGRLNDFDNLVARCKWPLDALVRYGFLLDDSPGLCWPYALMTQELVKKKSDRFIKINVRVL